MSSDSDESSDQFNNGDDDYNSNNSDNGDNDDNAKTEEKTKDFASEKIELSMIKKIPENDFENEKVQADTFALIPNFNTIQLFLIALGYLQPFGKLLLASQRMASIGDDDIKSDIDFNALFSKSSTILRAEELKGFFSKDLSGEELNEVLDQLSDRNPNFIDNLNLKYQKLIPFNKNISFVNLDDQEKKVDYVVHRISHAKSICHNPFLFYSKKGIETHSQIDFPFKVLYQPKFNIEPKHHSKEDLENILNKFAKKGLNSKYFTLSFIIGSKNNVPVLLSLSNNSMFCISDNNTVEIKEPKDLGSFLDYIYMLYYGNTECTDTTITLKSSYKSQKGSHDSIVKNNDEVFKDFIQYKYDNFFKKQKYNLISLIEESIKYPSFFGFCCGCDLETCFVGSVIIGADENTEKYLPNYFEKSMKAKKDQIEQLGTFCRCYYSLTNFAQWFLRFYEEVTGDKDDDKIENYLKSILGCFPSANDLLFDLFIDFLTSVKNEADFSTSKIVEEHINLATKDLKKNLSQALSSNEGLENATVNSVLLDYQKTFYVEDEESKTLKLKNPDLFASVRGLDENGQYTKTYEKYVDYRNFLLQGTSPKKILI